MSYLQNLTTIYSQLLQTQLVTTRVVNDKTMNEFKLTLDSSLPKNQDEDEFEKFIKASYRRSKDSFLSTLPPLKSQKDDKYITKHRCVILLTDPVKIVEEFKIKDLVYLKYDQHANEYIVQKLNLNARQQFGPRRRILTTSIAPPQHKRKKSLEEKFIKQLNDHISNDVDKIQWSDF
jgi:hypothetical protein